MSLPVMAEPAWKHQELVADEGMAVEKVLEAAAQIREILRPLTDYQQHTAIKVAVALEDHIRALKILSRSSDRATAERPDSEVAVPH